MVRSRSLEGTFQRKPKLRQPLGHLETDNVRSEPLEAFEREHDESASARPWWLRRVSLRAERRRETEN